MNATGELRVYIANKQFYRSKWKGQLHVYSLLVGYSANGSGMCGAFGNHSDVLRVKK